MSEGDPTDVPLSKLKPADLIAMTEEAEHVIVGIRGQLEAEQAGVTARGIAWKISAQTALRHAIADAAALRAERHRRDQAAQLQERKVQLLERHAKRREKENSPEALAKRERARERHAEREMVNREARLRLAAIREQTQAGYAELFMEAARSILSEETIRAIRSKVVEMYPDNPVARGSPSLAQMREIIAQEKAATL